MTGCIKIGNLFDIINVPLGYIIKFCYNLIPNYAIALLLFAIFIKIVLFPLGIKQQKNMVKQASLRPRETAIRKRYAGRTDKITQQKMSEEVMKFYQQENFNPAGGCLPMLVEFPILLSLYNVVTNPLKYICNFSTEMITALTDKIKTVVELSGKEVLTHINMINFMRDDFSTYQSLLPEGFKAADFPDFSIFGGNLDLSLIPSFTNINWLLVIPVVTFLATYFSMRLTRKFTYQPEQTADAMKSMKIMDMTMPLFSVWITFTVPAVVGLYWIYQNALSALRQFVLVKMYPIPQFTEEDYKNAERDMNGKVSKSERAANKKKVHSLHRIDEEDNESETDESENNNVENIEAPKTNLIGKAELKNNKENKDDK